MRYFPKFFLALLSVILCKLCLLRNNVIYFLSSADDVLNNNERVAIKKFTRPFQSDIHAKRTYRELKFLRHMKHDNVSGDYTVIFDIDEVIPVCCILSTYNNATRLK